MCKEVDSAEVTRRFWQEIYDDQGRLVEVHDKYPVDTGHRKV
jgi:YD repeat-containing protein